MKAILYLPCVAAVLLFGACDDNTVVYVDEETACSAENMQKARAVYEEYLGDYVKVAELLKGVTDKAGTDAAAKKIEKIGWERGKKLQKASDNGLLPACNKLLRENPQHTPAMKEIHAFWERMQEMDPPFFGSAKFESLVTHWDPGPEPTGEEYDFPDEDDEDDEE